MYIHDQDVDHLSTQKAPCTPSPSPPLHRLEVAPLTPSIIAGPAGQAAPMPPLWKADFFRGKVAVSSSLFPFWFVLSGARFHHQIVWWAHFLGKYFSFAGQQMSEHDYAPVKL